MLNQRFVRAHSTRDHGGQAAESWLVKTIDCGVGQCNMGGLERPAWLVPGSLERYGVGQDYQQTADEIHDSRPTKGCVTIVRRTKTPGFNQADVYWRDGPFVNAEPTPATEDQVRAACAVALENWE
jgi:hypothetical protein